MKKHKVTLFDPQNQLNGIEPARKPAPKVSGVPGVSGRNALFTPAGEKSTLSDPVNLRGEMGRFLGDLERYMLAITIEGDQGSGKTPFVFQVADAFAETGLNVGMFLLETGKASSVVERYKKLNMKAANMPRIHFADKAPEGIATVHAFANKFDVIVIDSWTKLDADSREFDKLRHAYPNTIWVVIFQRTSGGVIRGGTRPIFDAGVNIDVVKEDDTFVNNYAVCSKNRYGDTGIKYNVSQKKIQKVIKKEKED